MATGDRPSPDRSGRQRSTLGSPTGERALSRPGAGFVLLVALSGATMALQGSGSLPVVVAAVVVAALVGAALLWFLRRTSAEFERSGRRP